MGRAGTEGQFRVIFCAVMLKSAGMCLATVVGELRAEARSSENRI